MEKLIVPTVNLNGDSRLELVNQQREVLDAIRVLLEAMAKASPHGRNHQLAQLPQAATFKAIEAWRERYIMINELKAEIEQHTLAILNQGKD